MDDLSGIDLELEIAKTQKGLEQLADEQERNGTREYLDKLCQEYQRRLKAFFADQPDLNQVLKDSASWST